MTAFESERKKLQINYLDVKSYHGKVLLLHCKYIACKKGNFSMSFISHTFSMSFWLSNDCIKCSENNVKFKLECFLKLPYSIVVGTGIM